MTVPEVWLKACGKVEAKTGIHSGEIDGTITEVLRGYSKIQPCPYCNVSYTPEVLQSHVCAGELREKLNEIEIRLSAIEEKTAAEFLKGGSVGNASQSDDCARQAELIARALNARCSQGLIKEPFA